MEPLTWVILGAAITALLCGTVLGIVRGGHSFDEHMHIQIEREYLASKRVGDRTWSA